MNLSKARHRCKGEQHQRFFEVAQHEMNRAAAKQKRQHGSRMTSGTMCNRTPIRSLQVVVALRIV